MIFSRLDLAILPTPLHRLEPLSQRLGIDLWIKRDDLTGYGLGGNKVREAEFLLADALKHDADVLLTAGTFQSNHCRVIAAVAQRIGLECHLFLSGQEPDPPSGNFLLDCLLDAKIHPTKSRAERQPAMESFSNRLRNEGHRPYIIPVGGASPIGAYGYVMAFEELDSQLDTLPEKETVLVFASSTGTTFAGLLIGKLRTQSEVQVLGIRTDLDPNPERVICEIANALAERLGIQERVREEEVSLNGDYVGEDFAIPTKEGVDALRLLWRLEGIVLEPVYTAKGMAGLIDLARSGLWKTKRIIFLHTGGVPAIFDAELVNTLFPSRLSGNH